MNKPRYWLALATTIAILAACSTVGAASEKSNKKEKVKLGVEALTMPDSELFPDILKPPVKWTEPADYSASAKKGEKIFNNKKKGNCAACHCTAGTKGCGDIGPSLHKYKSELGSQRAHDWIYQKISDPRMDNPDTVMPPSLPTKTLKPEEVADVVAYLESLK